MTRNKKYIVLRFALLIVIIISLLAGSCSGRKKKLDKKNLIPEKELVSLLTDIHITDGLLAIPKINTWYSSLDSISTYYQVIEKHGYTKEIMDRTMMYYFIKNPKKLNKIYDQVLGILSEMESRAEKESLQEMARMNNLWPGKDYYFFPGLSSNDSTLFEVNLFRPGYYSLTFSVTLYPDDQSLNPKATLYFCSPDSIETGKRRYIKTPGYLKDGLPHTYNLSIQVPDKLNNQLRGWLFDFENCPLNIEDHVKIENISLIYTKVAL